MKKISDLLIKKIISAHKLNDTIETLAIVGSHNSKIIDKPNDIDCIAITTRDFKDKYFKDILYRIQLTNKHISQKSDDSFRFFLNDIEFGITYFEHKNFYNHLNRLINGNPESLSIINRPWVIGGKIQEVLLTDIANSNILFDQSSRKKFTCIKNKLKKEFPKRFQNNLLLELKNEIQTKLVLTEKSLRQKNKLIFYTGISDICIALIRYIYTKNNNYLSSLKHVYKSYPFEIKNTTDKNTLKKILNIFDQQDNEVIFLSIKKIYRRYFDHE